MAIIAQDGDGKRYTIYDAAVAENRAHDSRGWGEEGGINGEDA